MRGSGMLTDKIAIHWDADWCTYCCSFCQQIWEEVLYIGVVYRLFRRNDCADCRRNKVVRCRRWQVGCGIGHWSTVNSSTSISV